MAFHVRFVETSRGARIAFSVEGNGPPLVVLPPWTSHLAGEMALSGHKPFHDLLTEAHTVVRYDRWGTGLSDRDRTDFAPERDIEILAELADHLKLRRFTLLGPSHGGPLAVTYAVRQPRRVSHLVLYGSRASALTSGHTWAALRELILANWPVAARSIAAVATRGSDPGDVDAFTDLLIMAAAPETTVALQDAAIRDELTDLLSKVAVPTLVLHRRDDKLVSANEAYNSPPESPAPGWSSSTAPHISTRPVTPPRWPYASARSPPAATDHPALSCPPGRPRYSHSPPRAAVTPRSAITCRSACALSNGIC